MSNPLIITGLNESLTINHDKSGAFGVPLTVTGVYGGPSVATIHLTPYLLRYLAKMATKAAETMEKRLGMEPGEFM